MNSNPIAYIQQHLSTQNALRSLHSTVSLLPDLNSTTGSSFHQRSTSSPIHTTGSPSNEDSLDLGLRHTSPQPGTVSSCPRRKTCCTDSTGTMLRLDSRWPAFPFHSPTSVDRFHERPTSSVTSSAAWFWASSPFCECCLIRSTRAARKIITLVT